MGKFSTPPLRLQWRLGYNLFGCGRYFECFKYLEAVASAIEATTDSAAQKVIKSDFLDKISQVYLMAGRCCYQVRTLWFIAVFVTFICVFWCGLKLTFIPRVFRCLFKLESITTLNPRIINMTGALRVSLLTFSLRSDYPCACTSFVEF